jgi:TfoX/Sxy family transcriptional regulator of competence genes
MHGKLPSAATEAVAVFERLVPARPNITVRKLFGQPAAFVNGNLFMGVFGEKVFVRLSDEDSRTAEEKYGLEPFEPMAGRPMHGYVVLTTGILESSSEARSWVAKSLAFSERLSTKAPKRKAG